MQQSDFNSEIQSIFTDYYLLKSKPQAQKPSFKTKKKIEFPIYSKQKIETIIITFLLFQVMLIC